MAEYEVEIKGHGTFVIEVPDGAPMPTKEQVWRAYQQQQQPGLSAAPAPKKEASPANLDTFLGPALQGMTFGFADELAAGARTATDILSGRGAGNYEAYRDGLRAQLKKTREERPLTSLASEIVGSVPTMLIPGLNAARGPTLARTAWNAFKAGALSGGASGAGSAEGGLRERSVGAGKGILIGGGVGGVIPAATRATGAVTQKVADATADTWVGQALGTLPGVQPPGGARGVQKVAQAFEKDGLSPIQAAMNLDAASIGGKPAVLADAGRTATLRMGRDVLNATASGTADAFETLAGRADDAGSRVIEDLVAATGMRGDAQEVAVALAKQRAQMAAPLYERAYVAGARPVDDPIILGMLQLPEFQQAVRAGYKLAAVEGVNLPAAQTASGRTVRMPNLQVLDYVKRGLDDILYSGKRTGTIGKGMLRALETRRQEFLQRVDTLYPDYARARAVYSGETRLIEAVEEGQRFVQMSPREVNEALSGLGPGERQHFLLGAVDSIKQSIAAAPDGSDIYSRVFRSAEKRARLASLFPTPEAYEEFARRMAAERRLRMTWEAARGNSTTPQQLVGLADLADDDMVSMLPQAAAGNWTGVASKALARGRGNLGPNAEAALPVLFGDPRQGLEQLVRARQMLQRMADKPIRSSVPAGTAAGLAVGR